MNNNEFVRNTDNTENVSAAENVQQTAPAAADAQQNAAPQSAQQAEQQPAQQTTIPQSPYARTGYNPYASNDEPAVHQNSYQQPQQSPYGAQQNPYAGQAPQNPYTQQQPQHDFSRYQNTQSSYTQIPPRETVYINNQPQQEQGRAKKEKAPKGRLGIGAVACIVAVCTHGRGGVII